MPTTIERFLGDSAYYSVKVIAALANSYISLSLFKVEAPVEYHGLRTALSSRRVENAEDGSLHRTARKLGVFFQAFILPIPDLVKAYG